MLRSKCRPAASDPKQQNAFRPQVESLGDRILPTVGTGDAIGAINNRLGAIINDGLAGNIAAVASDFNDLKNDVPAVITEINTGLQTLISWYKAQSPANQEQYQSSVMNIGTYLLADQARIQAGIQQLDSAVFAFVADEAQIASGIFILKSPAEVEQDEEAQLVNAGVGLVNFLNAEANASNLLTAIGNLPTSQTTGDNSSPSEVQVAQAAECFCNGAIA